MSSYFRQIMFGAALLIGLTTAAGGCSSNREEPAAGAARTDVLTMITRDRLREARLAVDWEGHRFGHVLQQIANDARVPIWVDWREAEPLGYGPDAMVSLQLEAAPADQLLRLIVQQVSTGLDGFRIATLDGYVTLSGNWWSDALTDAELRQHMHDYPGGLFLPDGVPTAAALFGEYSQSASSAGSR